MPPGRSSAVSHHRLTAGGRPLAVVVILAGLLVFWNSLAAPFVFDDYFSVSSNRSIHSFVTALVPPRSSPVAGRPLVNLSFALNDALAGDGVRGYHAVNLAIHIVCALLLFAVARRTFERVGIGDREASALALVSALVWMVHPLESEVVDYISARSESLMALCYLGTFYAAIRALERRGRRRWSIACTTACLLGMASKESMATAPVALALYDRTFAFPSWKAAFRARRWLYVGLAATWLALAGLLAGGPRAESAGLSADPGLVSRVTPWTYLLNQAVMIPRYVRLVVWPRGLVLDYGLPRALTLGDVSTGAALVAVLLAATMAAAVLRPWLGFLGAWFWLTLAPASSLVPIHTEVGAERRMYLPMMAVAVFAVTAASAALRRIGTGGAMRAAAAAACVVLLALATVQRNDEFRSAVSVWQTVVDRWPHGRARYNLARQLGVEGRHDEMMSELRAAVVDYPDARFGLGQELFADRSYGASIAELRAFIRDRPAHENVVPARLFIGRALAAEGRYHDALPEYRFYLSIHAADAAAWTDFGIALAASGQTAEAVRAFERAAALAPGISDVHRNLANARLEAGDFAGAASEADEALRLNPADAVAREILGLARSQTK